MAQKCIHTQSCLNGYVVHWSSVFSTRILFRLLLLLLYFTMQKNERVEVTCGTKGKLH